MASLLLASVTAFVACGDSEQQTLCNPGDEVFCKCRGGSDGTKTCQEDGETFGECTTPEGSCPEIEETTSSSMQLCIPDSESPCSCDNGDEGIQTCSSDGQTFGDCMTAAGACGTTTTGDKIFYAKCSGGDECQTGVCSGGYCTRSCEDFTVCIDEANNKFGDCIVLASGTQKQCAPYCTTQGDCAGFGPDSACGGASALDDASLSFAACADWGDELAPMPAGTPCDSAAGTVTVIDQPIVMPCDIGLSGTQIACVDDVCKKGCLEADDCPNMDCNDIVACCSSDPNC